MCSTPASIETLIERLQRVLVAMTADPTRRLSSIDVLDAGEHARLDEIGNRAVLTQPATTPVSIPVLFAAQVARTPEAVAVTLRGPLADLPRTRRGRRIGWRTCWPATGWARDSVWRCCCRGPPRRSWRCWRCSRPGRPICRSTRRCPTARIEFMLADAAPIAAITTAGLADAAGRVRPDGHRCRRPRHRQPNPAPRCRRRPPTTSPTSSTPRAPPVSPRGWPSPTTT